MKTVLSPDMVAHTFAHQSQETARNSGNTLFFEHQSIYSYGKHFCIASFKTNVDGEEKLLFTTRGYSNTTAKHIRIVENATSHIDKIYCPYPDRNHHENLETFKQNIKSELNGLNTARKPEKYITPALTVYNNCINYCEFFDIYVPNDIKELIECAKTGKYAEYLQNEADRIEKEEKEAEQYAIKKAKNDLQKWRAGKINRYYSQLNGESYLRIHNNRIQTSQNIEIPVELGRRLFKKLNNKNIVPTDIKVLDYTCNEISKTGIRIGCHYITFKEINKIAKKLNWI